MRVARFAPLALLLVATTADAQFREGPPTLPRPAARPDPSRLVADSFARAYAAHGSPRLAVFWNRPFDDEVSSSFRDRSRTEINRTRRGMELSEETAGAAGTSRMDETHGQDKEVSETVSGTERVSSARAALVDEPIDWEVERAFGETLRAAGARTVDRATMIRMSQAAVLAGERANLQAIEAAALAARAELLIEVLQTPDRRSQDGISFRVTVRRLDTAELVADLTTSGRPTRQTMGYVAGPNGFERARAPEPEPTDIGRQLAVETMDAIARTW